jgi:hypothetical protein
MHDVQHISVSIARRPSEVYEFASDARKLPRWAAGLARNVSSVGRFLCQPIATVWIVRATRSASPRTRVWMATGSGL